MKPSTHFTKIFLIAAAALPSTAAGQGFTRGLDLQAGSKLEVVNRTGRVSVGTPNASGIDAASGSSISATSDSPFSADDVRIDASGGHVRIEVLQTVSRRRIDLAIVSPERTRLNIETHDGEVRIDGNFESAEVATETGTVAASVPTADVRYDFLWTASR
ncbi:MAG: hypothetical protein LC734_04030, partial [Acidobacteria bacterium]|nr:hypothetical protein [Acidobacteriota bacterium]